MRLGRYFSNNLFTITPCCTRHIHSNMFTILFHNSMFTTLFHNSVRATSPHNQHRVINTALPHKAGKRATFSECCRYSTRCVDASTNSHKKPHANGNKPTGSLQTSTSLLKCSLQARQIKHKRVRQLCFGSSMSSAHISTSIVSSLLLVT